MPIRDSAVSPSAARFRAVLEACSARNAQLFSDTKVIQTGRQCTSSVVPPCRHAGAEPKAVWHRTEAPRAADAVGFTPIVFRPVPGASSSAVCQERPVHVSSRTTRCVHAPPLQTTMAGAASTGRATMRPSVRRCASVCGPG
jgi:hypothetical protein